MPGNTVRVATQVTGVNKASSELDRMRDKFTKLSASNSKMVLGGLAAGAAFGLMAGAGSKVIDMLGDAAAAAREDELSQVHLRTALEANVVAFDGNTDAIEENIKAGERKGFTDEEQRDSMAKLVVATNDVNKALAIQKTAMDLARLKGISLASASEALVKVENGQFRALKALGIEVKAGMTSTEALAAVQKAAEGQAASYAQTNTGKLLVSQVAVGEAMEKVGYTIMPALAEATLFLARVTTDLATVASNFEPVWVSLGKVHEDNLRRIRELNPEYKKVPTGLLKIDRAAYESTKQFKHMADSAQDVKREVRGMTKSLVENAETLISDFFDPIHDEWDRHDARVDLAAQLEELASAKTKKARVDSQRAIVDALEDESQALQDLGEQGDLTIDDVNRFAKDVTKAYDKMGKAIPADILKIIRALEALSRANAAGKESVGSSSKGPGNKVAASGGVAGGRTLVGERGPEVVDLPPGSFVHPTGQVKAGSSGSIVINITGADVSSPQRIRDVIARGMRVSQGNPWAADGPWGT